MLPKVSLREQSYILSSLNDSALCSPKLSRSALIVHHLLPVWQPAATKKYPDHAENGQNVPTGHLRSPSYILPVAISAYTSYVYISVSAVHIVAKALAPNLPQSMPAILTVVTLLSLWFFLCVYPAVSHAVYQTYHGATLHHRRANTFHFAVAAIHYSTSAAKTYDGIHSK